MKTSWVGAVAIVFLSLTFAACGEPGGDDVASTAQELESGTPVATTDLFYKSVVRVYLEIPGNRAFTVTGVVIDRNHILTGARSIIEGVTRGNVLLPRIENGAIRYDSSSTKVAIKTTPQIPPLVPSGYNINSTILDTNGRFADLALLETVEDLPSSMQPILLSAFAPGDGTPVVMVGIGNGTRLEYVMTSTYRYEGDKYRLLISAANGEPEDSGGPIVSYDVNRQRWVLHSIISRRGWDSGWGFAWRQETTAVSNYFTWILGGLSTWTADFGQENNTDRMGNDYAAAYYPDWRACPLDCRYDSRCKAYTFLWDANANYWLCWLKSLPGTPAPFSGAYSGRKASLLTPPPSWPGH